MLLLRNVVWYAGDDCQGHGRVAGIGSAVQSSKNAKPGFCTTNAKVRLSHSNNIMKQPETARNSPKQRINLSFPIGTLQRRPMYAQAANHRGFTQSPNHRSRHQAPRSFRMQCRTGRSSTTTFIQVRCMANRPSSSYAWQAVFLIIGASHTIISTSMSLFDVLPSLFSSHLPSHSVHALCRS